MASPERGISRRTFLVTAATVVGGTLVGWTADRIRRSSFMPEPPKAAALGSTPELNATVIPTETPVAAEPSPAVTLEFTPAPAVAKPTEPLTSTPIPPAKTPEPIGNPTVGPSPTEKPALIPTNSPTEVPAKLTAAPAATSTAAPKPAEATATQPPATKQPEIAASPVTAPTNTPVKPAPTAAATPKPEPTPQPKPENPSAAFPKEIGDLQRDGVAIHNMGTRIGVIDNREDPQNNWQAVVNVFRQYAQGAKIEFFFYDNPEDVPPPQTLQTPYKYDPVAYWNNEFPEAGKGRWIAGQNPNGVWQTHLSLPFVKRENQNKLSESILMKTFAYSYLHDKRGIGVPNPPGYTAILRQQALDPYNSGKMNFSLKVVYVEIAGK